MNKREVEDTAGRIRSAVWRATSAALRSARWTAGNPSQASAVALVDAVNSAIAGLAARGCFADVYGDAGSAEIKLVPGLAQSFCAAGGAGARDISPAALARRCLDTVRELDRLGLIREAERGRYRTFALDAEEAERRRRAEEESERQRRAEEKAERIRRAERVAAAKRRLAEIEKNETEV